MRWDLQDVIAVVGVVVPLVAFVWEFAIVRRKRLGYRVQMDTPAASPAHPTDSSVLAGLQKGAAEGDRGLNDPSFVVLRIENAGWTEIVSSDYLADDQHPTGIQVTFPGRRVIDAALGDVSQKELEVFFFADESGHVVTTRGYGISNQTRPGGVVRLPKVKLNPRAFYKVLVLLERMPGNTAEKFADPTFHADVSGRHNRWIDRLAKIQLDRTESHTFASRPALIGIGLLAAAVLAQSGLILFRDDVRPPMDCVSGSLTLHGSTAFRPAITEAAERYVELCRGSDARIPIDDRTFLGSLEGINQLETAGTDAVGDHLAFSDGTADASHAKLLPHPIAYGVYTLVAHKDVQVFNLSTTQIQKIFSGTPVNWSEMGGPDLPIKVIKRPPGSGTRTALEQRVLAGKLMPQETVTDCRAMGRDQFGICQAQTTRELLDLVGSIPGAIGYSEVRSAAAGKGVAGIRIDNQETTLDGVEKGRYPYWQTEFVYSYGELPPDSIGAAFLRFLRTQEGMDILRKAGNRPCAETPRMLTCEPK
ncbi:PstS family phosphate ABC transporter substrate-binding protein [Actinoplanes couchii]|uniref:Phosphate-binding protein n=1 Tax=Actinoplanes couchii TaxID=403638 RepID=A0ABQ3XDH3_9ACTN|nr:substrate-binding domain-containing protein [Actinoplanes couchii]MDR6321399.1 ABC-type phosphate transport system substrate-binding protein [Actinoplanes couchii]GID56510.1 phosphate-binding protein [Actinoplanes couchii]